MRRYWFYFVAAVALLVGACSSDGDSGYEATSPGVETIRFNYPKEVEIEVGEKFTLSANLYPTAATEREVTWTLSNPSAITLTPRTLSGTHDVVDITGVVIGTTTVTATATNGVNNSINVTVVPAMLDMTVIHYNPPK